MNTMIVVDKNNLTPLVTQNLQNFVLQQPAIIQIGVRIEDVVAIQTQGTRLIIVLKNGEQVVLENFFDAKQSTAHVLVFPYDEGQFAVVAFEESGQFSHYKIRNFEDVFVAHDPNIVPNLPPIVQAEPLPEEATPSWDKAKWLKLGLGVLAVEGLILWAFDNDDKKNQDLDVSAPSAPTAVLDEAGKVLSGKAESMAKIMVKDADGKILAQTTADNAGEYRLELPNAVINQQKISVYAQDAAGNQSTATLVVGNKDTIAPEAANAQLNSSGSIVSGWAEAGTKVYIYQDDLTKVLAGPVNVASDGTFSVALTTALGKDATAKVVVEDSAGQRSPATTVIVGKDTLAPQQPLIQFNAKGDTLTGLAEANSRIVVKNAQSDTLASTTADAQGVFSLTFTPALDSKSTASLIVMDAANNSSKALTIHAGMDLMPPVAPKVSLDETALIIQGTAEASSKIEVQNAQGQVVQSGTANDKGDVNITLSNALLNQAQLKVYSIDAAGNRSSATVLVGNKDTLAPSVVILDAVTDDVGALKGSLQNQATTDDARPKFEGSGEPNATLTIYDDQIAIATLKVASNGTWSYSPTQDFSLGEHKISFSQMDAANNSSVRSEIFNFTVQATPPSAKALNLVENLLAEPVRNDEIENILKQWDDSSSSRETLGQLQNLESVLHTPSMAAVFEDPLLVQSLIIA